MSRAGDLVSRVKGSLPAGTALPERVWVARHRGILAFVFAHVAGLAAFGWARGWSPAFYLGEPALLAAIGGVAAWPRLGRRFRSSAAALAAVTCSAILVQFWGGVIEAHFHFFVVVAIISLYQDWAAFLLAIVYVAVDHGLVGSLAPEWIYNHPAAFAAPWTWALIHAVLLLSECAALVVVWKANETARAAEDAALRDAERERLRSFAHAREIAHLREIDAFKTNFLNTTAHELATPLTPLRIQVHVLKQQVARHGDPEDDRRLEVVERGVQRLSRMVDDLLEATRLQASHLGLRKRPARLADTIHHAVDAVADSAARKGIVVGVAGDDLPETVVDPERIEQVVLNLLVNATKFTPPGGSVLVETAYDDESVSVRVRDSGLGMTQAQIAQLFQPFRQVHDTMQVTEAGSGLGLYICKGIVDLHGGRLWCESPGPGQGTTFTFALPREGPETASRAPAAT